MYSVLPIDKTFMVLPSFNNFTKMYSKGIFVFGSEILDKATQVRRDAITALPLELSWKIFAYLDDVSLKKAYNTHLTWSRIIFSNKKLRKRLNHFELSNKLGSKNLARFYRRNKRKIRKERLNYLPTGVTVDHTMKKQVYKSKRQGDEVIVFTKRFKLF